MEGVAPARCDRFVINLAKPMCSPGSNGIIVIVTSSLFCIGGNQFKIRWLKLSLFPSVNHMPVVIPGPHRLGWMPFLTDA